MFDAASGVPEGSVLGPIRYIIYVNGLDDNLTINHLIYAEDFQLVTPENTRLPSKAPWPLDPNDQRIGS